MEYLNVNGHCVHQNNLQESVDCGFIHAELAEFLREWYSDSSTVELQTSGSTGTPKKIQAEKKAMRASAVATCDFFHLVPGDSALLCLPIRYIAGKMMVVRAIVRRLNLITTDPSSTPLQSLSHPVDFVPMVPMQVHSTLQQLQGMKQLSLARTILLGGGFIDSSLEQALQNCSAAVYASYGMTETLSHIALRRLNGKMRSDIYTPLPGVITGLSSRGTLSLSVPYLGIQHLETNDLAMRYPDGSFAISGRTDSVINSGGIKLQAETIEQTLFAATGLHVLALPLPHPQLGQCLGLLWEGDATKEATIHHAIAQLPKYHKPAHIVHASIPLTETGKPNRAAAAAFMIDKLT